MCLRALLLLPQSSRRRYLGTMGPASFLWTNFPSLREGMMFETDGHVRFNLMIWHTLCTHLAQAVPLKEWQSAIWPFPSLYLLMRDISLNLSDSSNLRPLPSMSQCSKFSSL